jgi:predicted PurR-regulated permease PerM
VPAPAPDPIKERLASEGVSLTGMVLGRGLAFAVSATATVILLYFLLASEHWLLARTVAAVPRRRARALLVGGVRCAQREIARFVRALALVNLGVGVVMGGLLHTLGLPNPLLWAVVCGLLNFVPYIGPFIIAALLLAAGLLSFDDAGAMVAPALAFAAVHAVESNLVSPWVVGRQLQLSALAIFLSVMFWGWLWGIAGAVIAVPMLIAIRSVCRRRRSLRQVCHYLDGNWRPPPSLATLLRVRRRSGG